MDLIPLTLEPRDLVKISVKRVNNEKTLIEEKGASSPVFDTRRPVPIERNSSVGDGRCAELRRMETCEGASGGEELVVCPLLDDAAVLHDENEVCVADR